MSIAYNKRTFSVHIKVVMHMVGVWAARILLVAILPLIGYMVREAWREIILGRRVWCLYMIGLQLCPLGTASLNSELGLRSLWGSVMDFGMPLVFGAAAWLWVGRRYRRWKYTAGLHAAPLLRGLRLRCWCVAAGLVPSLAYEVMFGVSWYVVFSIVLGCAYGLSLFGLLLYRLHEQPLDRVRLDDAYASISMLV